VRPDAVLEVARTDGDGSRVILSRVRQNAARRQELREVPPLRHLSVLVVAAHGVRGRRPAVRHVHLPDEDQATCSSGQLWHPSTSPDETVYIGRQGVIFACELDMHLGRLEARCVPNFLPGDARRHGGGAAIRGVRLPGNRERLERAA
jgi:hypothetical protein